MRRADLRELRTRENYPSVSILMPTHRAHPENQQDPIRLKNLITEARDRLTEEVGKRPAWPALDRLEAIASEIDWRANEAGLAVYANDDFQAWYRLPFPVEARVSVDRAFDTREIFYALHRMPRYRVIALAEEPTRLFEGSGTDLEEVRDGVFPLERRGAPGATRRPDAPQMRGSNVREAHLDEFYTEVSRGLNDIASSDRLPLVVMGVREAISHFNAASEGRDMVAEVEGNFDDAGAAEIASIAWPRFSEWLDSQRQAVLDEIGAAKGGNRFAPGLDEAWATAREGRGAKLAVEAGYRQPAVVERNGWTLRMVSPDDAGVGPEHLDDAVDELIELVLDKGGEVVFVEDGSLEEYGRVGLILRY